MRYRKIRRIAAGLLGAALLSSAVTGCGKGTDSIGGSMVETAEETAVATTALGEMETKAVTESASGEKESASGKNVAESAEKNADKNLDGQQGMEAGSREVTDMAGRTVVVPEEIDQVFSTGAVAAIYLYTLDPDRLLGWNYDLNEMEKSAILPEYQDLTSYGQGDSINYEAVIAAGPQIALTADSCDGSSVAEADRLSETLGIPVLLVSDNLEDTAEVYRFLGDILNESERGEELAAFVDKTFQEVAIDGMSEDEQVTVYYGNGENSLQTAPRGSQHGKLIQMAGGLNVAELEAGEDRVQISLEQLLAWDPDYIIVNGEPKKGLTGASAAEKILEDPNFASLKAVQNGNVYGTPNIPFSWIDRPQGPNRVIGLRWLSGLIYPERSEFELKEEVREFYRLFYHMELTDEKMKELLGI